MVWYDNGIIMVDIDNYNGWYDNGIIMVDVLLLRSI